MGICINAGAIQIRHHLEMSNSQKKYIESYIKCSQKQEEVTSTSQKSIQYQLNLLEKGKTKQDDLLLIKVFTSSQNKIRIQKIKFDNGISYEGQWKNGRREGFGIQIWPGGSYYQGQWINNKANGQGKLIHSNGSWYVGEWQKNKIHGWGVYFCKNGNIYEGDWRYQSQNGDNIGCILSQFITISGHSYEQQLFQNKKHSFGLFKWNDRKICQGHFKLDDRVRNCLSFIEIKNPNQKSLKPVKSQIFNEYCDYYHFE